jgi:formate/nitrite transporter FocA (FNT family)
MFPLAITAFAGGILIGAAIVGIATIITNTRDARRPGRRC